MADPAGEVPDAEVPDAEVPDAEVPDAEVPDAEVPDAEVPGRETPDDETSAAETLAVLGRALLTDVDALADRLTLRILDGEDVYTALGVPVHDDLRATCRASLERLLTLLAGDLPAGVDAAALTVDTGRRRARQGVPLEVVLRAYRLSGRLVWEGLRAASRERGGRHDAALLAVADRVWRVIDASSDRLVDAYRREEGRLRGRDLGRRWSVLEGLLEGRGRNPSWTRDAARVLDLPEDAELVCVVAPTPDGDEDPLPDAPPADPVVPTAPVAVWHTRSAEVVGVLVPPPGPTGGEELLEALRQRATGPVGVSPPVAGLARLDVAHRWARLAARTLPSGRPGVATLDERLPEALLLEAPELVGRLRRAALGGLLDLPAPERRTLEGTLRAVLAAGGSPSHAAAALYCHRNTVMYRLARLEVLTGRRVGEPRDRMLLELALADTSATAHSAG